MTPLIQLKGIEKSFPTRPSPTFVLRQVSLEFAEGDFVSIMGPSGAGKSTLLNILGLHDSAWTGEYFLGGTGTVLCRSVEGEQQKGCDWEKDFSEHELNQV